MKVVRSELVAMLLDISVKNASSWSLEEATKKVNEGDGIVRYLDKGEVFTKPEYTQLFDKVAAAQFMGDTVEVVDDPQEPGSPTPPPVEPVSAPEQPQEAPKETPPKEAGRPLIEVLTEDPEPEKPAPKQQPKLRKSKTKRNNTRKVGMVGGTTTLVRESRSKPPVVKLGKRDTKKNGSLPLEQSASRAQGRYRSHPVRRAARGREGTNPDRSNEGTPAGGALSSVSRQGSGQDDEYRPQLYSDSVQVVARDLRLEASDTR